MLSFADEPKNTCPPKANLMGLKVLHITRTSTTIQVFFKPLIAAELARGHTVELAFGDKYAVTEDFGVPVHRYPIRRSLSPFALFSSIKALAKVIKTGQYDVIVTHMVLVGMISRLAFALAGKPGKLLYASHGLAFYPQRSWIQRITILMLERFLRRFTDGMIVLNDYDYRVATKYKLAGETGTVHLLRSVGINCSAINQRARKIDVGHYRRSIGLDANLPVVCYAGRFIKAKGVHLFIRIAQRFIASGKKASFVVAGSGPLEHYLERFIAKNKLEDYIKMLGWYDDTVGLLAASDVLCFPTLYEGAPVIVQEAMASGTAVLSSKVPGPEDLVDNNITGVLIEAGDVDGFCEALTDLLENKEKRLELSLRALEKSADFDLSVCLEPWLEAIEAVSKSSETF